MAVFFVTYFLVDYESTDSILKIYFSDALEIERFYYFSMYAVYVCPLMFLFEASCDIKKTLVKYLDLRGCYKSSS